jgi:hypothetical protein
MHRKMHQWDAWTLLFLFHRVYLRCICETSRDDGTFYSQSSNSCFLGMVLYSTEEPSNQTWTGNLLGDGRAPWPYGWDHRRLASYGVGTRFPMPARAGRRERKEKSGRTKFAMFDRLIDLVHPHQQSNNAETSPHQSVSRSVGQSTAKGKRGVPVASFHHGNILARGKLYKPCMQ